MTYVGASAIVNNLSELRTLARICMRHAGLSWDNQVHAITQFIQRQYDSSVSFGHDVLIELFKPHLEQGCEDFAASSPRSDNADAIKIHNAKTNSHDSRPTYFVSFPSS